MAPQVGPQRLPPSQDASRSLHQYKVYEQMYRGETSSVFEAVDRRTGAHVVLKVYSKRLMDEIDRDQLEREVDIHSCLSHPNIIDFITAFEDDRAVYIVQKFAQGGDLFSALHHAGRFHESRAAGAIIAPLLSALDYIHAKGIIHRDVKIENILLDARGDLKLADFGLAIDSSTARPGSRLGTWEYMAPEIHLCPFKGDPSHSDFTNTYSTSVDTWAVGILAYELLVGKAPFQAEGGQLSYQDVMAEELTFPKSLSADACSFIKAALCKRPRLRPSARQLLGHRWLKAFVKTELLDPASPAISSPVSPALVQPVVQAAASPRDRATGQQTTPRTPLVSTNAGDATSTGATAPPIQTVADRVFRRLPGRVQSLSDIGSHHSTVVSQQPRGTGGQPLRSGTGVQGRSAAAALTSASGTQNSTTAAGLLFPSPLKPSSPRGTVFGLSTFGLDVMLQQSAAAAGTKGSTEAGSACSRGVAPAPALQLPQLKGAAQPEKARTPRLSAARHAPSRSSTCSDLEDRVMHHVPRVINTCDVGYLHSISLAAQGSGTLLQASPAISTSPSGGQEGHGHGGAAEQQHQYSSSSAGGFRPCPPCSDPAPAATEGQARQAANRPRRASRLAQVAYTD